MKVQIDDLIIEFANRMAIFNSYGNPYDIEREYSKELFTIACLALPKYDKIISLEKTNKLGGASKLAIYGAFEFYDMKTKESIFDRKEEVKKYCRIVPKGSIGYYYEPINYDTLQDLSLDFELNSEVEIFVENDRTITINPHDIIIKFLRKYKLDKLNGNSKG